METDSARSDMDPDSTSGIQGLTTHLKLLYQEREIWTKMYPETWGLLPEQFSKGNWIMNPVLTANFDMDELRQLGKISEEGDRKYNTFIWDDLDELFGFLIEDGHQAKSETGKKSDILIEEGCQGKSDTDQMGNKDLLNDQGLAENAKHRTEYCQQIDNSYQTEHHTEVETNPGQMNAQENQTDHTEKPHFLTKQSHQTENETGDNQQSNLLAVQTQQTDHPETPDLSTQQEASENDPDHSHEEHDARSEAKMENVKRSKFLQIEGEPGSGKSAALQCLALNWSKEEYDGLNGYSALFVIPVLKVETQSSLMDILGESQLDLVPSSEEEAFKAYLSIPSNASKVVFLIDSIGDRHIPEDSDLARLIQGTLYPDSTVIAFNRSHLEHLELLRSTKPLVKFTLIGMADNSRFDFMEVFFHEQTNPEADAIMESVKKQLYDIELMVCPSNLALICSIINKDETGKINTETLTFPEDMGSLFKEFCCVLLKHWLQSDEDQEAEVTFDRSPLDDDSTVPVEIQNQLYKCGQLCFKGLVSDRYEFSLADLQECQLLVSDIGNNSFFKIHQSNESAVIYTRTKQLQSYLAGLYLSYEGVQDKQFLSIFQSATSRRAPLSYILEQCHLDYAVQIACGLSASFLEDLLSVAKRSTILLKNVRSECVDIYYECSLYQEAKCEDNLLHFQNYLITSPVQMCTQTFFGEHFLVELGKLGAVTYYQNCLKRTVGKFDQKTCLPFLLKFYQLAIDGGFIRRVVVVDGTAQVVSSDHLLLGMDQLQLEMLSRFQFINVKVVVVRSATPAYFDIETILRTMKGVRVIDIAASPIIPYGCNKYEEIHELENSVAYLSLLSNGFNARFTHMPDMLHIVSQKGLQHLFLENVDILTGLGRLSIEPDFPSLTDVHISCQTNVDVAMGIYTLLLGCRSSLKKLQVSFRTGFRENSRPPYIITTELQELRMRTSNMKQRKLPWASGIPCRPLPLWIFQTEKYNMSDQMIDTLASLFEESSIEELGVSSRKSTVAFIQKCAMKMPRLRLLAVHASELVGEGAEAGITQALAHISTLESFHIWGKKGASYTFPKEHEEILKTHGIAVDVITPKTPESLDEYIQMAMLL